MALVTLPIRRNFVFRQDADFRFVYTLKNPDGSLMNTSGWDVRMQMRATADGSVQDEITTANGRITLGGAAGTITLVYPKATIAALTWTEAVYDIRETPSGGSTIYRFSGGIAVRKMVTRG